MSDQITIIRGDDYSMSLTFTNADGTAVDLTGCSIKFTAKPNLLLNVNDDTNAIIAKTITTHSDPTHGITTLVLSATDTAVASGRYVYDLQLKTSANKIHSSVKGDFIVNDDVTKSTT